MRAHEGYPHRENANARLVQVIAVCVCNSSMRDCVLFVDSAHGHAARPGAGARRGQGRSTSERSTATPRCT